MAQEDRVVCVHLALLSEMMHSRPWTVEKLEEMGGATGIGIKFLDEHFGLAATRPEAAFGPAAQDVLETLLPPEGVKIKTAKTYGELQAASQLPEHEFDNLLRLLDTDLRLITATEKRARRHETNSLRTYPLSTASRRDDTS